jgi:hypothetical protein
MHDLDRTQRRMDGRSAGEQEGPAGAVSWRAGGGAGERPADEMEEMALASQLLEVTTDRELEQFLGGLLGRVGAFAGRVLRSDTGQALQGILGQAARQALPVIGRGVGGLVAPGRGGDVGARLAAQAGRFLGLELEGLSPEDREFETARQFVRFALDAAGRAAAAPAALPPAEAARSAAAAAASRHAPGLLGWLGETGSAPARRRRSGRWDRRGRTIVIDLGGSAAPR